MKIFHLNSILILIFRLLFLSNVNSFPCPPECICIPTSMTDDGFTRMNYIIDCTNVPLNNNKLIYNAQSWSINEEKILDDEEDDGSTNDYRISIDLSNTSLKQFNNQTIQLTAFDFSIQSLSLTNQFPNFIIQSNAFYSSLYNNLEILNLSSCCQQIPKQCPQLFQPLIKLEILDLSGSDMYKSCLNTEGTISSTLKDLILQNNKYDMNTFSHSSQLFNGVNKISGKLDLQNSRFNMSNRLEGNCLFDIFQNITTLDLSSIKFDSISSNDIHIHITHLLKCKILKNEILNGKQLLYLNLRYLNLEYLPKSITNDNFPQLIQLDLSNNYIHSIEFHTFTKLSSISLAYNPIQFQNISWRPDSTYKSINLRSTNQNQTYDFTDRIQELFNITTNLDYSENNYVKKNNLTKFLINIDFSDDFSLNLSQTNLYSFQINDISKFEDLNRLDLNTNYLTELNLEKQSKLSYLDCSNQKLKNLILNKDISKLTYLKCSNNSLKTIENFALLEHSSIQFIDLSFNLIDSLDTLFPKLNSRYLHTINLQSNSLTQLSSNLFHEKLISLYSINLSWNKINLIQSNTFQSVNLQILDLTGNPLKLIETKFLFSSSLHLFFIFNSTQELIDRCKQSTNNDNLLLTYITWFQQNGTYMKTTHNDKSQQIQFDKCLTRYTSRSKTKWMNINDKNHLKHLSLYITMTAMFIGIILGMIYYFKKNRIYILRNLQRYRRLDRQNLMETTDHHREDDEIVMNLDEPPFTRT